MRLPLPALLLPLAAGLCWLTSCGAPGEARATPQPPAPAAAAAMWRAPLTVAKVPAGGIAIDGDLGEWGDLGGGYLDQILDQVDLIHANLGEGQQDAATFQLRRDDTALYVGVRVFDGSVTNKFKEDSYHQADCVELFLDVRPPTGAGPKLGDAGYSDGVYQLMLVPPCDGQGLRWRQANGNAAIGAFEIAAKIFPDGYGFELKIPFASLAGSVAARFDQPFGCDVQIDDLDLVGNGASGRCVYTWGGSAQCWINASKFSRAMPADQAGPAPTGYRRAIPARLCKIGGKPMVLAALVTPAGDTAGAGRIVLDQRFVSHPDDQPGASQAKPPGFAPEVERTIERPALGVALHYRMLEPTALTGGHYYFTSSFPGLSLPTATLHCYHLDGTVIAIPQAVFIP
jgi:hypothetical protein